MRCRIGITLGIEDKVPELAEDTALQEVSQHISGRAVLDLDFTSRHMAGHKELSNINVMGPLATGAPVILLK